MHHDLHELPAPHRTAHANWTAISLSAVFLLAAITPVEGALTGTWQTAATWSNPRGQAASVVDANTGRVYLFGGYSSLPSTSPTGAADAFDPSTGTWSTLAPMPIPIRGASAVLDGGKVYIYGGFTTSSHNGIVEIYDLDSNSWTTRASELTIGGWETKAVSVGGMHYIQGGEASSQGFWRRNFNANSMTALANAPSPHFAHGLVAFGTKIYDFGGFAVSNNATAANDVFDLQAQTWSTAPADMPSASGQFAFASDGQNFYVAGGSTNYFNDEAPFLNQFLAYDPQANLWQTGPTLPVGLRESAGVVAGGKFYVFGGFASSGVSGQVYAFSVPEPTTLAILTFGATCFLKRRRRATNFVSHTLPPAPAEPGT